MPTPEQIESDRRTAIAMKALHTAKWARIMTKWIITHSSKNGVKWQVVSFNGKGGQESYGIVDMIAVRKNHKPTSASPHRGDFFEIVLIQVKGGSAKAPTTEEVERLIAVKEHHQAAVVVLIEWKKGETLRCYELPNMVNAIPASRIFGKVPTTKQIAAEVEATASAAKQDL